LITGREGDKLAESTDNLYQILKKENLLGKNCKQRSAILKSIFKLLDVEEPRVLLRLARLILAVSKCILVVYNTLLLVLQS